MHLITSLLLTLAIVLTCVTTTGGQGQATPDLKVGDASRDIIVKKLLQAPGEANLKRESLKGNVVVLEFWATWCAPCIAAFPHINEMSQRFKDKPVRFIAITSEDASIVEPFLKRRIMKTWIGLDTDQSTMKAYSVKFFPTTIVIDREGKVAAITQPKRVTEQILNDLLDGKSIAVKEPPSAPVSPVEKQKGPEEVKPLFAVTIKPSESKVTTWSLNKGRFNGRLTVKTALSIVHDVSEARIVGPPALEANHYVITASITDGTLDDIKQVLGKALETSFRVKVHRETREVDAFVLTAPQKHEIRLRRSTSEIGHWSDDQGVMAAAAAPFRALVDGIEAVLKRPVFDETGLEGKFDWDLLFDANNPDSIAEAIRKDLGLELKPASKPIELLIVQLK